jgi:hypothetical protein
MTTPTTNLGASSIQAEFGGSNPIAISEYYRGGANVPSGQATSAVDGNPVPASGQIRFGEFRALTKAVPVQPSGSLNSSSSVNTGQGTSHSVTAQVTWSPDGTTHTFRNNGSGGVTTQGSNWYVPTTADIGHSYYAMTVLSVISTGSTSGLRSTWSLIEGTVGSGNGVTLSLSASSTGNNEVIYSSSGTLQISANASGSPVLATWNWSLGAAINS